MRCSGRRAIVSVSRISPSFNDFSLSASPQLVRRLLRVPPSFGWLHVPYRLTAALVLGDTAMYPCLRWGTCVLVHVNATTHTSWGMVYGHDMTWHDTHTPWGMAWARYDMRVFMLWCVGSGTDCTRRSLTRVRSCRRRGRVGARGSTQCPRTGTGARTRTRSGWRGHRSQKALLLRLRWWERPCWCPHVRMALWSLWCSWRPFWR